MSEKDYSNIGGSAPTAPTSAAYAGLTGVVQASPPSYFESLGHPVVGASAGVPLGPQVSSYAQQQQKWLANYYTALEASLMDQQSRQYQQQAAISQQQQAVFLQQQAAYIQQQQAAYSQQAAAFSQQPKGVYYQPQGAVFPPSQSVVVVPNGFDAGARFDSVGRPTIPPPPPGVAPNAAQLAAQAGVNVAMTQKKGSYLSGGSSGGYTFW